MTTQAAGALVEADGTDGPASPPTPALSGRKAQAARNDTAILEAARTVFLRDPSAPIAAVAQEAGVGISALYRRFAGKEAMLQRLCADGLRTYIAAAESSLAEGTDPWQGFVDFVTRVVDEDVHALTVNLAGTFRPTQELGELAVRAIGLGTEVFQRADQAGELRAGLVFNDVAMILEQATAIRLGDPARAAVLRRRYLALQLEAVRGKRPRGGPADLPGPPPTDAELGARWTPREG